MEETEDRDVHDAMCSDSYSEDDVLTDDEDEMMRQKNSEECAQAFGDDTEEGTRPHESKRGDQKVRG